MTYTTTYSNNMLPDIIEPEIISIDSIVGNVAQAFYVERHLLFSKSKQEDVKFARWAVWYILRKKGYSYKQLGNIFKMDHTTVINALSKFPDDIKKVTWLKKTWERVKDL